MTAAAFRLLVIGLSGIIFLAGCAAPGSRGSSETGSVILNGPRESDLLTMISLPNPPELVAQNDREVAELSRSLVIATLETLKDRRGARALQISAIPFLRAAPAGAAFLQQSGPRALAQGAPSALCPVTVASNAATSRVEATANALTGCLRGLAAIGADAGCGCRLMAVDTVLLAPQEAFSFAPVVSAVLIDAKGRSERLVAESVSADPDTELVLLRDAAGERARLILVKGGAALVFSAEPDIQFSGTRQPFGYRRGRVAERLRMTNASGDAMTLLIGVEMRDVVSP